ncbi:3-methyl-2-oxobutanoate hydroxymethyltransferase [Spirochaetota bacterium]
MKLTVSDILNKKKQNEKITMLTAYDFSFAGLIDEAGIDIILIGDSLANVLLGMESTKEVTMEEMINHSKAVTKAATCALTIGDMPYCAYQEHPDEALKNALRFTGEAGCDAVKLEWFDDAPGVAQKVIAAGIPVQGHIGLTPQTADKLGGFKVQGKDTDTAKKLIDQAKILEEAGCFSIVLECIPMQIAEIITKTVSIPTIGIGAGNKCDGQVLVMHDLLGLFKTYRPKFVKVYTDLGDATIKATRKFIRDVKKGSFPGKKESYTISAEELEKLKDI